MALAWQPRDTRGALAALFSLDERLAQALAHAREPLMAQVRLAWWRERLTAPVAEFPAGEPLLTAIAAEWGDRASDLVALVDGWEELVGEDEPSGQAIDAFAEGRGSALGTFARLVENSVVSAAIVGRRWALADLAARSHQQSAIVARTLPKVPRLPRSLRGLAVLDALAARSLARREPMLAGRAAALLTWRVGMTGR